MPDSGGQSRKNPLPILLFLIPLIVYHKTVHLSTEESAAWSGSSTNSDFYFYYRMVFLLVLTGLCFLVFAFNLFKKEVAIKSGIAYFPLGTFAFFVMLSTVFAKYKGIAIFGFMDSYQGMFTLLSYPILFFLAYNLTNGEETIKRLLNWLLLSVLIISVIGGLQLLGWNFFSSSFGKFLTIPSGVNYNYVSLFNNHAVFSTFSNPNYLGCYLTLVFPIFFVLFTGLKKSYYKYLLGAASYLIFLIIIGSQSRAGLTGIAVFFLLYIYFLRTKILASRKPAIFLFSLFIVSFACIQSYLHLKTGKEVFSSKIYTPSIIQDKPARLNLLYLKNNRALVKTSDLGFELKIRNKFLVIRDSDSVVIPYNTDFANQQLDFSDKRFMNYQFLLRSFQNMNVLEISKGAFKVDFALNDTALYFVDLAHNTLLQELDSEHYPNFMLKESLGDGRGFLWSRSASLLGKSLLLGFGPDHFIFNFPQNDFAGKYNAFGSTRLIIEGPHNFYLQTALNTGILSVLSILILFSIYVVTGIKIYSHGSFDSYLKIAGLGLFLGSVSYLCTLFFNDSVIAVAPVFWILLGMGCSINILLSPPKLKDQK